MSKTKPQPAKKPKVDTKKLQQEFNTYNKRILELRARFAKNGIDKKEQAILDALAKKIKELQKALDIKVIDFSADEEDVIESREYKGQAGIPFEQQIVNILQTFRDAIQNYWSNYHLGVDSFESRMDFSSEQEAQPEFLQAVFKGLAKEALSASLTELGKRLGDFTGPFGQIVAFSKAGIEAWANEKERVQTAEGQVKIADYLESIRNGIPKQRDAMFDATEKNQTPLIEQFRKAAKGMIKGDVVMGEGAQMLKDLSKNVAAFKTSMPTPSYWQQQFAAKFANTPGKTDLVSHGGIPSGTMYFDAYLKVDPDDKDNPWKKGEMGDAWRLVTKAPSPERVAANLQNSLEGKKPWQIDLPKMVSMRIEVVESGTFTPNKLQDGYIYFRKSPDQFEVRSNYISKQSDFSWFREAWTTPGIRQQILESTDKIVGSSE